MNNFWNCFFGIGFFFQNFNRKTKIEWNRVDGHIVLELHTKMLRRKKNRWFNGECSDCPKSETTMSIETNTMRKRKTMRKREI